MRYIFLLLFVVLYGVAPTATAQHHTGKKPIPVIFETDMGNDVDDVLALDMLYKLVDQG